jgi:hypothetical protein
VSRAYRPPGDFTFPGHKRFAFSVFDDTDVSTANSVRPVYDLLDSLGLRITKTVWPLRWSGPSDYAGSQTLEDEDLVAYVRVLAGRGFEIAFHGATMESSSREDTARALRLFQETLGFAPRAYAAHSTNRENLYWGAARFQSALVRGLYSAFSKEPPDLYQGHREDSGYFWGDLSQRYLSYVRGFTFDTVNLWRVTPHVCYRDSRTPWVRQWFITADADNVEEFVQLLSEPRQEELERDGGVCIVSTHLGKGFVRGGQVEKRVEKIFRSMAKRDGWFAPVSAILDHLSANGMVTSIGDAERRRLEWCWLLHSLRRRLKRRSYYKAELAYLGRK